MIVLLLERQKCAALNLDGLALSSKTGYINIQSFQFYRLRYWAKMGLS